MSTRDLNVKTVAVLGGSYGGYRAAQVLAAGLPSGWTVVLVDRNSHFNHVYNFPRYAVLPGHEHKAFIPYDNVFGKPPESSPHRRVHGTITSLHPHHVTYAQPADFGPSASQTLHFDYAIYALGSHLPSPIDVWGSLFSSAVAQDQEPECPTLEGGPPRKNPSPPYAGTKLETMHWLRSRQRRIEAARQVLVVGGGALGIQFASDIAAVYPRKSVTLLHSRSRLLPRFDEALGDEICQGLQELGVHVIFGERLDMSSLKNDGANESGNQANMSIRTVKGREIETDLVLLCTGQTPNTTLLRTMDARTLDSESGMVRVSGTMQILAFGEKDAALDSGNPQGGIRSPATTSATVCSTVLPWPVELDSTRMTPVSANHTLVESEAEVPSAPRAFVYPHLFAIGDAADAFGAIKAGHTAYYQGEVAARNVIRLVKRSADVPSWGATPDALDGGDAPAEDGTQLETYAPGPPMIKLSLGLTKSVYEVAGVVGTKDDGTDDLGAAMVWGAYGYGDVDEEGMWR